VAVSAADFADELGIALFGGGRGSHSGGVGLLNEMNGGALFVDEIDLCSKTVQAQVLASLRSHTTRTPGASTRAESPVHFIAAGAMDAATLYGGRSELRREFVDEISIDGVIELAQFRDVVRLDAFWNDAFETLYRRAASDLCGLERESLFSVVKIPQGDDAFLTEADAVLEERRGFMDWTCEPERIERMREMTRAAFAGYAWPGDLREFDAALRTLIGSQTSAELNSPAIEMICARLRGNAPVVKEKAASAPAPTSPWLGRFEDVLKALPLSDVALPQVITDVEAAYFKEAARRAGLACHPRPAKIQDVARLLGIPRQTASRKWQSHGFSSAMLTKDQ
jgi:DNA-binding NtrC family response regulator